MAPPFSITSKFSPSILDAIIALGDANSEFLGHFPKSAYQREASDGRILAAVSESDTLLGYLLFRVARERAVVQHCCVDHAARGSGVGKALVDELKKQVANTRGIELHCAREFEASCKFWERMSFIPLGEKKGRGADQRPLTRYVFDHRQEDCFGSAFDEQAGDRVLAAVDMNIVLDWHDPARAHFHESSALRADWLRMEVDLRITDYTFTDANQAPDLAQRERTRSYLRNLPKIDEDRDHAEQVAAQLKRDLNLDNRRSTDVDIRHLAAAIAGDANFFITRDRGLLDVSDPIREKHEITVCDPTEFILKFDSARRTAAYEPVRLSGCSLVRRRMADVEIESVVAAFVRSDRRESHKALDMRIRSLACDPMNCRVEQVLVDSAEPVMLLGTRTHSDGDVELLCLRARKHPLSGLICRHVLRDMIRQAADRGSRMVRVTDEVDSNLASILTELAFESCQTGWTRSIFSGVVRPSEILADSVASALIGSHLEMSAPTPDQVMQADHRLWPAQLESPSVRSIVVPIQPQWAVDLFDAGLASSRLLDAEPRLMLNLENVYYTAKPTNLRPLSRVLWYVSKDESFERVGAIRAASWIAELHTGPALDMYRRFRHLGVYRWHHVAHTSKQNEDASVTAFRFCNTVEFKHPISRKALGTLLAEADHRMPPLSAPYTLQDGMYERICRMGHGQE